MSANYPYNVESSYGPVPIVSTDDAAKLSSAAHGGDSQNSANDPQSGGIQHSQQPQSLPPTHPSHPSHSSHPTHPTHPSNIIKEERSKDLQDVNSRSTQQHVSFVQLY